MEDYITSVLETGNHGPCRHIPFDLQTLDATVHKFAHKIAGHIKSDVARTHPQDGDEVTVSNVLGNVSFKCEVSIPHTLDELSQLMAKAKTENKKVKAVGGFFAFSSTCETTGYLVKTDNLTGVSPTPLNALKDTKAKHLYNVLCGTKFKKLVQELEKDGRAVMNLGGFTGQAIVGATSTGTHGSGLTLPPLASMIRAVHLVSAKFDPQSGLPIQYHIEPTDGITDPAKQPASSILVQDDNVFNATVTGLGALGVVYSVTIATVPFYWIREMREMIEWPAAKTLLEQGPQGGILSFHNAEVWVNPYTSKVLVTRREKVETKPKETLADATLSMFVTFLERLPAIRAVKKVLDDTNAEEATFKELGVILSVFLRHFPLLVPSSVDLAMSTQNHSKPKIAKYYDIYDIGQSKSHLLGLSLARSLDNSSFLLSNTGFANDFPAISTEISFPMTTYIAAADSTISLLQSIRKKNIASAITSPISLRFTASTPVKLSMSYNPGASLEGSSPGRCYIEMPSLLHFYNSLQGYSNISQPYSDGSINKFEGRLHWGQFITPSFTVLEYKLRDPEFFASIAAFRSVAEEYDPQHMMANDFLARVVWLMASGQKVSSYFALVISAVLGIVDIFKCGSS